MKNTKRIISLILVFVLSFSMFAFSASAVEKIDVTDDPGAFPIFNSKKIKSVQIALDNNSFTKLTDNAVIKVYYYPDADYTLEDGISIEEADRVEQIWNNLELNLASGIVEYIGEVPLSDVYFGEEDYRDEDNFFNSMLFLGTGEKYPNYDSLHIKLTSLNLTEKKGDYAVVIEEGSLSNDDGSVINKRIISDGLFNFNDLLTGTYKLSYIALFIMCILNFKLLIKGY